jgi:hypothetical protein
VSAAGRDRQRSHRSRLHAYLQNGQQQIVAALVAAAAAVPNSATNVAASADSFIFIVYPFEIVACIR